MNRTRKYIEEQKFFKKALLEGDHEKVVFHLSRMHILSQNSVMRHMATHLIMFLYALLKCDFKEVLGQVLRLVVTVPGHVFGKVPRGNIGWSTVGLMQEMPIPDDLKEVVEGTGDS